MRRNAGLAASLFFTVLALAACGHGTVIGSGPLPTPTPIVPKVTNEFPIPTANSNPGGLTVGGDGFIYFTEQTTGKIGQVTTGGTFKEFTIASSGGMAGNNAIDITSGPDGNLWFTERGASPGIGMMTLADKITEYPIAGGSPARITPGPVPKTLVFTDPGTNSIGQITTAGTIAEIPIPTANSNPLGIAVNSADAAHVYFVEHDASRIGILNVQTGTIDDSHPTLTPNAGPTSIAQGPDGALWFTENNVAKIGRITTSGVMTEYPLAPATSANGLVSGVDNNLYFGDTAQNKIGRISAITPSSVSEYSIPSANAFPGQMLIGPDGLIYFTEVQADKIGQLNY